MFHLTRHKYWFFLVSGIIIVPGLLALIFWHLNLGIDFTNGDTITLRFARPNVTVTEISQAFQAKGAQDVETFAATDAKGSIPAANYAYIQFDRPIGKQEEATVLARLADAKYKLPTAHKDHTLYTIPSINGSPESALMVVYFDSKVTAENVDAALQNLPNTDAAPVTDTNPAATTTPSATASATAAATASATTTPAATATATATPTTGATTGQSFPVKVSKVELGANPQTFQVNTQTFLTGAKLDNVVAGLGAKYGPVYVQSVNEVGPSIASDQARNAFFAVLLAALFILLYIGYAFRKVGSIQRSLRFGASAIIALLHDVLVVLGLWAIFGRLFNFKVDTLFLTAILTVIGFSVHDTIVVFDRIRENLSRRTSESFETIADASLIQTMSRSLNTSLTVLFTLSALSLFGGDTIREFTLALLIGIASGTYSSIFNASMILVVWENEEYRHWFGNWFGLVKDPVKPNQPSQRRQLAGTRA
ncbi:MAG TPA: protein translocase subunit SecF [Ktedonobacterales bacterium]